MNCCNVADMTQCLRFAFLLLTTTSASAGSHTGIGRPIDGDSLMVGEREVRLFGIDAPEFS